MTGHLATACGSAVPPVGAGEALGTDRFLDLRYQLLGLEREAGPGGVVDGAVDGPLGCPSPVS